MSQKAKNLVTLANHGIMVPRGFVLDETHYREAIAPFEERIARALPKTDQVVKIFSSVPIPRRTAREVETGLQSLEGAASYAVRSSGSIVTDGRTVLEDSSSTSMAGQFESYLQVPRDMVLDAVRLCWASLFNRRSLESFGANADYIHESAMSVVVQEMVPAIASAVMMTVDPLGVGDVGGIELMVGPCEAIVSGIASPDEVMFSRSGGDVLRTAIGRKELKIEYEVFRNLVGNGRQVPVTQEERNVFSVSPEIVASLIRIGHRIECIFGTPQDVEIVITPSSQIMVTQARAITCVPVGTIPFCVAEAA